MCATNFETQPVNFLDALGSLTFLSLHSELHRAWDIAAIENNYLPALETGQCKIYYEDGNPSAFVTWAFLSDAAHLQLMRDGITPPLDQWALGENLWFMDIVAPFGNALAIIRDLQRNHFPDRHAYSIKRHIDGSIARVKIWRNGLALKRCTTPEP